MENSNCVRANKVTAYFAGDGKMIATFYKTHDKLGQVCSTDEAVINAGFVMPTTVEAAPGVEPKEVQPADKLAAFKAFVIKNATVFGFYYDEVDRRSEGAKYPSTYDQAIFTNTAKEVLKNALTDILTSLQNNVVAPMINQGHVPAGTQIGCSMGEPVVTVQESYKNGNLKYATAEFSIQFGIGDKSATIDTAVKLVSGQLQKPRNIGKYVFTQSGLKTAMIDKGLLPRIEKVEKKSESDGTQPAANSSVETPRVTRDRKSKNVEATAAAQ